MLPGLTVVKLVDVFVAVNAYTTYPLLVVVLQVNMMEQLYFSSCNHPTASLRAVSAGNMLLAGSAWGCCFRTWR